MRTTLGRPLLSGADTTSRTPAWRVQRQRRLRQCIVAGSTGAAIGALAQVLTALTDNGIYAYLAVFGVGGIGLVFGVALIVGLNLGRPLSVRGETPSEAMPSRPFTGLCVLAFAIAVIVIAAIVGGLLSP